MNTNSLKKWAKPLFWIGYFVSLFFVPLEYRFAYIIASGIVFLLLFVQKQIRAERHIICFNPQCGYRGQGKVIGADNGCLLVLLFCCGILPAILYILFCGKKELICPNCGCKIR